MEPEREEVSQSERIQRLRQAMYSRSLSKNIKTKPRRDLRTLEYGVSDDFVHEEDPLAGSAVAPRTIGVARTAVKWLLGASIVFFVVTVCAFIYYFIFGAGSVTAAPGNIDIAVRGPLSVIGGEVAQFQIIVTNKNKVPLELADLIIRYPDGTRSAADFLTTLPEVRESLGTIEPGGQRQGTVKAVLMGQGGTRGSIGIELEYRISNSNAIFVSDTDYAFTFANAPISVTLDGNDETISGQRVALTATIRADSAAPLRDVVVQALYPFGFTPEILTPEPDTEGYWVLGDMNAGDVRTIVIRGTLEGQQGDDRVFRMVAGTRKDKKKIAIDSVLSETIHHMAVARPFLGLDVTINKEAGEEAVTVAPGETAQVTLSWVNNLDTPIQNAVIVARLSGLTIPGSSFQTAEGFYRSADKTILFDRTTTKGELAELKPGARGSVSFSFTVPAAADLVSVRDAMVNITVHAAGKRTGEANVPETLQSTAERSVKLASDVRIIGQGFYYQNPFGSVGPLPPRVDQETTYALVFTISNTSNKIQNAKVTGQLPPYVRWVGVYSPKQERVSFSSTEGTISWDLGTVEPGVGVGEATPRQVAFVVGFTPSSSQIGEEPSLITELTLTGKDMFTGRDVVATSPDVTTNLLDDAGFSTTEAAVVE